MIEKEQALEPALSGLMNDIGKLLHEAILRTVGKEYGFALFMFGLAGDEKSRMNYISDCNREDMIAVLKEFIARVEGRYDGTNFTRKQ